MQHKSTNADTEKITTDFMWGKKLNKKGKKKNKNQQQTPLCTRPASKPSERFDADKHRKQKERKRKSNEIILIEQAKPPILGSVCVSSTGTCF